MRKERRLSPSPTYSTTWVVAIRRTPRPPPGRPPILLLPKNSHHPPTSAAAAWKRAERWKELWKVKKDEEKMGKPEWKRKRWMQKKRPLTLSLYGQLPWKEGEFFFSFSKCHFFLFHFDSFVWAQPLSSQQPRDHVTTSTVRTRGIDLQLDQLKIWNVERSWINKEYNWATYTHATGLPLSSIWNLLCQWGALWSAKAWIRTSREDCNRFRRKEETWGDLCATVIDQTHRDHGWSLRPWHAPWGHGIRLHNGGRCHSLLREASFLHSFLTLRSDAPEPPAGRKAFLSSSRPWNSCTILLDARATSEE